MKKLNSKYWRFLVIGVLLLNLGTILNYFVELNNSTLNIFDFIKGISFTVILASAWHIAKESKCKNLKQS